MVSLTFIVVSLFLFILGTVVGSFLSVVIVRATQGEQWMTGRSRCDSCKKNIAWYDNIPLLSYLVLGGTCRRCRSPIPAIHPVVEMLTGVLFVWWYWGGFLFFQLTQQPFVVLQPLFWLAVAVLLVIIFFTDLLFYLIPDVFVWFLLFLTLGYRLVLTAANIMQVNDLLMTGLAALLASGVLFFFWWLTKGKGMGFGDVKLALPLGLLLGWPTTMVGLALAFVIGAIVGILLVVLKKKRLKGMVPFGPFLIVGSLLSLLWGDQIFTWYMGLLY